MITAEARRALTLGGMARIVSEDRREALLNLIEQLSVCDPRCLSQTSASNYGRSSAGLRANARLLMALLPDGDRTETAARLGALIGNQQMDLEAWDGLVRARRHAGGREATAAEMRLVARLLRAGHERSEVRAAAGVTMELVDTVSAFIGSRALRDEALASAAYSWVEDEADVRAFADRIGERLPEALAEYSYINRGIVGPAVQALIDGVPLPVAFGAAVGLSPRRAQELLGRARKVYSGTDPWVPDGTPRRARPSRAKAAA